MLVNGVGIVLCRGSIKRRKLGINKSFSKRDVCLLFLSRQQCGSYCQFPVVYTESSATEPKAAT